MKELQTVEQLSEQMNSCFNIEAVSAAIIGYRKPIDIFHGEKGQSVMGFTSVKNVGDIWVVQSREYLAFMTKTGHYLATINTWADDL